MSPFLLGTNPFFRTESVTHWIHQHCVGPYSPRISHKSVMLWSTRCLFHISSWQREVFFVEWLQPNSVWKYSVTNLTYEVVLGSFHWLCIKLPVVWTLLIFHFVMDILCLKYLSRFDIRTLCLRVFLFVSFTAIVLNSFHYPLFILALYWKVSIVDLAY
jgi:hypothetical protein